ncbi:AfsR/SARP family transcriptional regulator [Mycobacterium szulgai]|uniref:Transcriptional regulator n=1 Tax=Mycobacterium szulgai TaxID=1787 RepID=A0A1X2FCV1_MYCSZ|nr:BTAD domain-containing putative transcriptional regulator [Mycobacterium szulgai]MCV7075384.1 AfsR/SARP family transcriptional regulator [Mycobacterium szulgai]ORX16207.1 transcriptional regulator [Mycobacterium szulgai]
MTVEFRLLGDVEVRVDERRLEIGHARRRCVLVALLIDVNHPVSPEQLVDRVWSDRPPRRARNSLAGYVSRLRTLLADAGGVVISRGPAGYMLGTHALSVDLHRFRHLAAQARTTADPVQAAALFERALGEWSGEPFMFLDTPWFNEVRSGVQAERFAVELDRNDAALRAGRHADLLADLIAGLSAHPLDERLAAQLMLAQYRCGRQADALDTYRQTRTRLIEQLGVEPGQLLSQVHQRILAGEADSDQAVRRGGPAADAGSSRALAGDGHKLAVLRRTTSFVGHEEELARTVAALRAGPLVTLTGVGGVGKTRLAFEVARREQDRFADGVWVCELGPVERGDAVGHTVAAAFRVQQHRGLDIEASVIEYLRSRELLLVVDNCEHVLEAAADLVERIVQQCPGVLVLATSRQPLSVEGEHMVVIEPLPVHDATRLFADRAQAGRPDFNFDVQPIDAVAEICRRVDCLPLGVELAAARMRVMSAPDVVRRLDRLGFLRGAVRGAPARQQSLAATIDWSYRLLAEPEQALFARLSVFAGSFDLDAAHAVCGPDGSREDDTLDLLAGLVDKSMVVVRNITDRTRYSVLETLRAYGRERLQEQGIDNQLAKRHALYFTELAAQTGAGLHTAQERDWVERMLPDYDNLRVAFERAMSDNELEMGMRLVASVAELVGLRIGFEVAEWAERLIAMADPAHPLFVAVVGTAARGAWNGGNPSRARALVALVNGRIPDRGAARIAYPADVQADMALFSDDPYAAWVHWDSEALRARREGDPIRLVQSVSALAVGQAALGNPDAALTVTEESVAIADSTGNPTAQSMAYFSLGYLLKKSEPERAIFLFDEAARLAGDVQNRWWFGIALMEGAATRAVHGDPAEAARMFIDVLDHWERVGDWVEQWVTLRYITRFLARLGAEEDALFLHCMVVTAGKRPPLRTEQLGGLVDRLGSEVFVTYRETKVAAAKTVARARSCLQRYAEHPAVPVV